jgi:hypothetical protein
MPDAATEGTVQQTVAVGVAPAFGPTRPDPLPSWNEGPTRDAIVEFVEAVTDGRGPDHVPTAEYELRDGVPVLVRLPELDFYDDGDGKPMAIQKFVGRRPIAAVGNSDGDLPLLQWTAAGAGRRLLLLVDHTDAEREYAYQVHPTGLGRLETALAEARRRGWLVADTKGDWRRVVAFE